MAVAGSFSQYLNGTTPRFYSPCGTCLDRGVPQRYAVTEPYYNFLGITAQPIREGCWSLSELLISRLILIQLIESTKTFFFWRRSFCSQKQGAVP